MYIKIQEKNSNIYEIKNSEKLWIQLFMELISFGQIQSARLFVSDSGKQIEAALYQNL